MMTFPQDEAAHASAALPLSTRSAIRRNLGSGAAAFLLLMGLTLLMLFTPVFDGHVGGVGVGYIVGFGDFAVVMVVAVVHCVRSNRLDDAEAAN